jgi:hypothetical protein
VKLFLICLSLCVSVFAEDRSNYQTDPERLRNDARTGIIPPNATEQYELHHHQNLDAMKLSSTFGLGTIQLSCKKSEFGLDVIGTLIGHANHSYCVEYNYIYWLRLNWSCESEKDSFVRKKILNLAATRPQMQAFDKYKKTLDPLAFKINASYDSVYTITKEMYDNLDHIVLKTNNQSFTLKRSAMSLVVLVPGNICDDVKP